jgi:hypothetical protein
MVAILPVVPVRKYCAVYYLALDSYHGMEEVIGSIPIRSTNHFINKIAAFQRFSSLTASSNPGDKKAHSQRYLETLASGNEKAPRLQGAFRV